MGLEKTLLRSSTSQHKLQHATKAAFNHLLVKLLVTRCATATCASACDVNEMKKIIQDGAENADV